MPEVVTFTDTLDPDLLEAVRAELSACDRRTPEVTALATVASLARSIEPELLRALRVGLGSRISGKRISVSAESALWFSNFVESRGTEAITLLPEALRVLRPRLANDPQLLEEVRSIVEDCHQSAPDVLKWEERIVYLALTGKTSLMEDEVMRGLRSISSGTRRPLVNWISDMWLRLPPEASSNPLIGKLRQVAAGLMKRRPPGAPGQRSFAAEFILDFSSFPTRELGVVLKNGRFIIGDSPDARFGIQVPDLDPIELDVLAPSELATTQPLVISRGGLAEIEASRGPVRIRTFAGQLHLLDPNIFRPREPNIFRPSVYISYSHKDKDMLGPLVSQLKTLEQAGLLEVWSDTRIDAGDKWYPEIEAAMSRAAVAVCLISENFLASDFCTKQEVPFLLKRSADEGLSIIPVLLSECVWKAHRWLRETQILPGEGQTVRTHFARNPSAVFARVAKRVYDKLNDQSHRPLTPPPVWPALAPELIDRTRLPETGSALFSRDDELKLLDEAWQSTDQTKVEPTRLLVFTAHGGVGKSTLVNHWLAEMAHDNYRGATRVFGWSFYSQGMREGTATSADTFIDAALRFFGDSQPTAGSPWDRGQRLANLVGSQRALLVLDGLEPLQSSYEFERGKLRDPALEALLRRLTRESAGLCLITTREPLTDLTGRASVLTLGLEQSEIQSAHDLEQIPPQAGRALLRTARVVGTDTELEELASRFGPHALAVTLLGIYLYEQPGHGIGPAKALEQLPGETPIDRVLAGFDQWLGDSPEREALRLLGFFDRPADSGCLRALRTAPPISGLTLHLTSLDEADWERVLNRLNKLRLIRLQQGESGKRSVDAHPLIREHFAQLLKGGDAWRDGHRRIYKHLCETTKEGDEPTLEDLQPLFQAVAHGSQADLHQEAFDEVYVERLQRNNEGYLWRKLGAFNFDLGAIACFFEQPWSSVASDLSEQAEAYLLHNAAFDLRALGRLIEAREPMRAAVDIRVRHEDWKNAATSAGNLSELELTLGEVAAAMSDAEQSVKYADHSGDAFQRGSKRETLGDALNQGGRRVEAERVFREAEQIQAGRQTELPLLYSTGGFRYCDLLLTVPERMAWQTILQVNRNANFKSAAASCRAVAERATQTLKWMSEYGRDILSPSLDHLTLSRAALCASILESSRSEFGVSPFESEQAIAGLRRAGQQQHLPHGLLTRAWLRFLTVAPTGPESAQTDLDEAWEIAERGPMKLFMADIHLYRARLFHAVKPYPWTSPQEDLAAARKLIEQCGYWRRKEELEDAEEAAKNW